MQHQNSARSKKSTIDRTTFIRLAFAALSLVAPPLAVRLAERLFLTPPRPRRAGSPQLAAGARAGALPFEDRSLVTWQWGDDGPTALLVHGWGGHGLQIATIGRSLAATGWRAVAVELPAHGGSPGRSTNLLELAAAVAASARHLGSPSLLVAHSFGTAATLVAMDRHGVAPERLVALAPATHLRELTLRFAALTGFTPAVVARMRRRMAARLAFRWHDLEGSTLAPGVAADCLVIHDRDDREVPVAEAASLAGDLPHAELDLRSGLGHHALLTDPAVAARVTAFADHPHRSTDHVTLERRTS